MADRFTGPEKFVAGVTAGVLSWFVYNATTAQQRVDDIAAKTSAEVLGIATAQNPGAVEEWYQQLLRNAQNVGRQLRIFGGVAVAQDIVGVAVSGPMSNDGLGLGDSVVDPLDDPQRRIENVYRIGEAVCTSTDCIDSPGNLPNEVFPVQAAATDDSAAAVRPIVCPPKGSDSTACYFAAG